MRSVLRTIADNSETMTAPEIGHELEALLERTYGIKLDLSTEKRHFNELVLGMEERLRQRIRQSDDPLGFAIRLSMAGNFIDFGQTGADRLWLLIRNWYLLLREKRVILSAFSFSPQ